MNKQSTEFDHILSICLDQFVDGNWTIEECLANFPEHGESLEELLTLAQYLRQAQAIRPEPDFYQSSRRRLTARLRPRNPSLWQRLQWWVRGRRSSSRRRNGQIDPWSLALAAVTIVVLLLTGGVTVLHAASDPALPGDTLYPLDLRFEELKLRVATNPDASDTLRLQFSEERLSEAETLATQGDDEHLQVALVAYAVQLQELAQEASEPATGDPPDAPPPPAMEAVGSQLNAHEARLDALYQQLGPVTTTAAPERGFCDPESGAAPHPVATMLAQQYQLNYEDVISWSCAGHSFGEILLALTTASANELSAEDVLALKEQTGGWGQVWHALAGGIPPGELPGRGNDDAPGAPGPPEEAGPPEDAGPPDDQIPGNVGPPDYPGPPADAGPPQDAGPPDYPGPPADAGPPQDAGRPDYPGPPADTGPPQDAGPPEDAGPPDDAGPPGDAGPPDNADPSDKAGPSDNNTNNTGPPQDAGPPEDAGPPDNAGPPPDAGPPEDVGPPQPNSGGKPE